MNKCVEPKSVQEALQNPAWKQAIDLKMKVLIDNNTWFVCDLPSGRKPVGCKGVYHVKYKFDGTVGRFKVRLVAKVNRKDWIFMKLFLPLSKWSQLDLF